MSHESHGGHAAGGNFHGGGLHGNGGLPSASAIPTPVPTSKVHDIVAATGDPRQLPSGHLVITLTAPWSSLTDADQTSVAVPKRPVPQENSQNG